MKIKVIIVEDNEKWAKRIEESFKKALFNYDVDYEIYVFDEDCDELQEVITGSEFKIYSLDVELKNASGIDIARRIRKSDLTSIILICSIHVELMLEIFKSRLLIFDFITKYDIEHAITENLKIIMRTLKNDLIQVKDGYIRREDILYIEKIKNTHYVKIVTLDIIIKYRTTINEINKKMHLKSINKSLLINENNIKVKTREKIVFKNNTELKNKN